MEAQDFDDVHEVTSSGTVFSSLIGIWTLKVGINPITHVTTVGVPAYVASDPSTHVDGLPTGRDAFLNAMKSDNGGRLGMGYRKESEKETKAPDPYFACAPRFTNVGYSDSIKGVCVT